MVYCHMTMLPLFYTMLKMVKPQVCYDFLVYLYRKIEGSREGMGR